MGDTDVKLADLIRERLLGTLELWRAVLKSPVTEHRHLALVALERAIAADRRYLAVVERKVE